MYTIKEVGRGGARRASLGHLVGGQLHRFYFVPEVPTCWGQQATGIACRPGGTPAQTSLVLRCRAECWACTAPSLRRRDPQQPLRRLLSLVSGSFAHFPVAPLTQHPPLLLFTDTWMRLPFVAQPGSGPPRGLLRARGPSVQNRAAGFRLSPGSHSESHAFPVL